MGRLALIAGQGALPGAVAAAQSTPPLVCALRGFAPDGLSPDITFRIETLGGLLSMLRARDVAQVCLCGRISRPAIDLGAIDDETMPLIPRLRDALGQGDDGALRAVIGIFEDAGFEVLAAHEAAPRLLPAPGVPTAVPLPDGIAGAATLGDQVSAEQGAADLGQACVIRDGRVIAREDEAGTDAMLAGIGRPPKSTAPESGSDPFSWMMDTAGDLIGGAADWLSGADHGPRRSGILYKAPKPGQDRRADLPVIGPGTARAAAAVGLQGIVIEAGGVMVLDLARVIAALDEAGMFLWVRERPA